MSIKDFSVIEASLASFGYQYEAKSIYANDGTLDKVVFEIEAKNPITTKHRDELPDSDFVDKEKRAFPINSEEAVRSAVSSWGRYRGSLSFEEFKRRLTEIATRKGWASALPEKWEADKKD